MLNEEEQIVDYRLSWFTSRYMNILKDNVYFKDGYSILEHKTMT